MAANPSSEKKNLLFVLGLQNPTQLVVSNAISSQLFLTAINGDQTVNVLLQPPDNNGNTTPVDLLGFAPIASWRNSDSLFSAVDSGYLFVSSDQTGNIPAPPVTTPDCCGIPPPANAQTGDLLMFVGGEWQRLAPGTIGQVLTSGGPTTALTWAPAGSGGSIIADAPLTGDGSSGSHLGIQIASTSQAGALSSTDWNTFNGKEHVLTFTAPLSRSVNAVSIPAAAVSSDGYVTQLAQTFSGDKTIVGNLAATNLSGTNTGNVSLGTANGLSITGQALSLGLATTSLPGALSAGDWTTFNGKEHALTFTGALSRISDTISTVDASASVSGVVTTGTQTFAGAKTFSSQVAVAASGILFSDSTVQTTAATGGSTPPGGATTQIQFNLAGAFAGSPNLVFDGSGVTLQTNHNADATLLAGNTTDGTDAYAGLSAFGQNNFLELNALSDSYTRGYPGCHPGSVQVFGGATHGLNIMSGLGSGTAGSGTGFIRFIATTTRITDTVPGNDADTRVVITPTGSNHVMGIGTLNPLSALDVVTSGTAGFSEIASQNTDSANSAYVTAYNDLRGLHYVALRAEGSAEAGTIGGAGITAANAAMIEFGTNVSTALIRTIGATPLAFITNNLQRGRFEVAGHLALAQNTSPTASTGFGKIYPKADNNLYFMGDDGVERQIQLV